MSTDFRIVKDMKEFIFSLDKFLVTFPKKEKVLTDSFKKTSFEILELIYYANACDEKVNIQKQIVSKINMLDFYFELAYKNHYISHKLCINKCDELLKITKMIYGWIKNG